MNDSRWLKLLDKRPEDRSAKELSQIATKLRKYPGFEHIHSKTLFFFAKSISCDTLDGNVTLFKQGDERLYWYYLIDGSLTATIRNPQESALSESSSSIQSIGQVPSIEVCSLGIGCSFGFSFKSGNNHSFTSRTPPLGKKDSPCVLLKVKKDTYNSIWSTCGEANKLHHHHQQQELQERERQQHLLLSSSSSPPDPTASKVSLSPSLYILKDVKEPSANLLKIGWIFRVSLLTKSPGIIKSRKISRQGSNAPDPSLLPPEVVHNVAAKRSMVGSDLVDWLMSASAQTAVRIHSRSQATSMLQVLYEDGVLVPVDYNNFIDDSDDARGTLTDRGSFEDKFILYRWWFDIEGREATMSPTQHEINMANSLFSAALETLISQTSDCNLRSIFRKDPRERTDEDITLILDELMRIHSLTHLTASMKQELAHVICYEYYPRKDSVVFSQGDLGSWWYLIYRGSVNVEIVGKGTVCTLRAGDEFGKLALVNNAPRAATIITNEENTQFFKVHKDDFNRILVDVEANTIRLKEHGADVLILLKVSKQPRSNSLTPALKDPSSQLLNQSKLVVIAGTHEKMIDYLLESKFDMNWDPREFVLETDDANSSVQGADIEASGQPKARARSSSLYAAHLDLLKKDTFFQDFILTHVVFVSTATICNHLRQSFNVEKFFDPNDPAASNPGTPAATPHQDATHDFSQDETEYITKCKKRVVRFIVSWKLVIGYELFFSEIPITNLLNVLFNNVMKDNTKYGNECFKDEINSLTALMEEKSYFDQMINSRGVKKIKCDAVGILQVIDSNAPFNSITHSIPTVSGARQLPTPNIAGASAITSNGYNTPPNCGQNLQVNHSSAPVSRSTSSLSSSSPVSFVSSLMGHMSVGSNNNVIKHPKSGPLNVHPSLFLGNSSSLPTSLMPSPASGSSSPCPYARDSPLGAASLSPATPYGNSSQAILSGQQESKLQADYNVGKTFHADPITARDEIITRIYCADHTYTTLKYGLSTNAGRIKEVAADKLSMKVPNERLLLVEVKSSGERIVFSDSELSIGTGISINSKVFITLRDHLDALTPLPEQDGPSQGTYSMIEDFTAHDLAHHLTYHSWQLFINVHERELIFQVFGRKHFGKITSNLDLLLRHFEQVQFWVTTELVLCSSISKRINLLRKFIKTAGICKDYQNLHTFFAIILGLSNTAVSRLTQTWERLPSKFKRVFSQYESLIDPSRNHRKYRLYMTAIEPPVIPFVPLLLKDMTFANEGNKTLIDGQKLVNFEKMQMLAQAMRTFKFCRSKPLSKIESIILKDPSSGAFQSTVSKKNSSKVQAYIQQLRVIDNPKILITLSHQIEPSK